MAGQGSELEITTEYPAEGEVGIRVVAGASAWVLALRVPAWCEGASAQGNDQPGEVDVHSGKLVLPRSWAVGDVVALSLPTPALFSWPDPRIDAVRGQVPVERGSLVLCLDSAD